MVLSSPRPMYLKKRWSATTNILQVFLEFSGTDLFIRWVFSKVNVSNKHSLLHHCWVYCPYLRPECECRWAPGRRMEMFSFSLGLFFLIAILKFCLPNSPQIYCKEKNAKQWNWVINQIYLLSLYGHHDSLNTSPPPAPSHYPNFCWHSKGQRKEGPKTQNPITVWDGFPEWPQRPNRSCCTVHRRTKLFEEALGVLPSPPSPQWICFKDAALPRYGHSPSFCFLSSSPFGNSSSSLSFK